MRLFIASFRRAAYIENVFYPLAQASAQGRLAAALAPVRLMLLGSPPDMIHGDTLRGTDLSTLQPEG